MLCANVLIVRVDSRKEALGLCHCTGVYGGVTLWCIGVQVPKIIITCEFRGSRVHKETSYVEVDGRHRWNFNTLVRRGG